MLFKPELCDLILAGKKTQTRRIARVHALYDIGCHLPYNAHYGYLGNDLHIYPNVYEIRRMSRAGIRRWLEIGRTYAVQPGRGKHAVARIRVTAIRYSVRAGDISEADAIAEGFGSAEEFRAAYARINSAGALERPCWALTFALVDTGRDVN